MVTVPTDPVTARTNKGVGLRINRRSCGLNAVIKDDSAHGTTSLSAEPHRGTYRYQQALIIRFGPHRGSVRCKAGDDWRVNVIQSSGIAERLTDLI